MKNDTAKKILISVAAILLVTLIGTSSNQSHVQFKNPSLLTGWCLLGVFIFLCLFNIRKRLPMLPLGSAATWLFLHTVGGFSALALFWLHTKSLWPQGFYEQFVATFFYLVTASGVLGFVLQRIYPLRLTQTGVEVIYERIPAEIEKIRAESEALVAKCAQETASHTLAKYYLETLDWYFRCPRFVLSHALGWQTGQRWIDTQCEAVKRYLDGTEIAYLNLIILQADHKNKIDFHYAAQSVMKGWLLFHVPLTLGLVGLTLWHVIVVHVYLL